IRLGAQEVTRLGMKESEMEEIAEFVKRVVVDGEDPEKVGQDVAEFRKDYQKVHYAFDTLRDAYEYIQLR
ncbi:serine hydroxymethyltransferase, partial [archaeon]